MELSSNYCVWRTEVKFKRSGLLVGGEEDCLL